VKAVLIAIAIAVYVIGIVPAFTLVHGTDYYAQGAASWWPTVKDFGLALLWPIWLVWFVAVCVWYWVGGFMRGGF
jgi:hypothetical protein